MLKDWNTMENANLIERKLLKRVDELPIGTVIYGLNPDDNEVGLWVVGERVSYTIYLYTLQAYLERTFIVKADDGEELRFKDTDVCKAREYFKDKTYKHVYIQSGETILSDTPNISRFRFNVYPTSKKSYEIKVEPIDTRHWVNRIHYKTYVFSIIICKTVYINSIFFIIQCNMIRRFTRSYFIIKGATYFQSLFICYNIFTLANY
jgi:hypothetical protein